MSYSAADIQKITCSDVRNRRFPSSQMQIGAAKVQAELSHGGYLWLHLRPAKTARVKTAVSPRIYLQGVAVSAQTADSAELSSSDVLRLHL